VKRLDVSSSFAIVGLDWLGLAWLEIGLSLALGLQPSWLGF